MQSRDLKIIKRFVFDESLQIVPEKYPITEKKNSILKLRFRLSHVGRIPRVFFLWQVGQDVHVRVAYEEIQFNVGSDMFFLGGFGYDSCEENTIRF